MNFVFQFPDFTVFFTLYFQVDKVQLLDRYNPRKPAKGTLYLTATHLIFVDPDGKKETWVSRRPLLHESCWKCCSMCIQWPIFFLICHYEGPKFTKSCNRTKIAATDSSLSNSLLDSVAILLAHLCTLHTGFLWIQCIVFCLSTWTRPK